MAFIDPRMWDDDKFIALPDAAQSLWLYLLSGPHTTTWCPGLCNYGIAGIADGMRKDPTRVRDAMHALTSPDVGMVELDEPCRLIRLPRAPYYNRPPNQNVARGWFRRWTALPESILKYRHIGVMVEVCEKFSTPSDPLFSLDAIPLRFSNGIETISKPTCREEEREDGNGIGSGKAKAKPEPGHEAQRIALHLSDAIRSHRPDFLLKPEHMRGWARDIDLALRVDKRTPSGLCAVIDYAHRDARGAFWRANVLSGAKLREKYDQLEIQRSASPAPRGRNGIAEQSRPQPPPFKAPAVETADFDAEDLAALRRLGEPA